MMKRRTLGAKGPLVSALGLGCMGMSGAYGHRDDASSTRTLHLALESGITLLDTADSYGHGDNEQLIGRAVRGRRDRVILATKFGLPRSRADRSVRGFDGRPENARASCEASLRRLGVEAIDLFYLHRVDPVVPVEDTVGAMAGLVREGKVRYLGLCEVDPATLRKAHREFTITSLQSEYSPWSRDAEHDVLPTCRELGIGFVAASPLGRGFLTGELRHPSRLAQGDQRLQVPRFQGQNFWLNLELVGRLQALAAAKGCTPGQLALAWVLAQGDEIIPIPGTTRREHLEENLGASNLKLTTRDLAQLSMAFPPGAAAGDSSPLASVAPADEPVARPELSA